MKSKKCLLSVVLCMVFVIIGIILVACDETVSVMGAYINNDGELVLTYSDGSSQNLGVVSGEKGEQGDKGDKGDKGDIGVGVEKVYFNADGTALVVEFTNGEIHTIPLPKDEYDGVVFRENADGNYSVVDYLGAAADVVIPDEYNGRPVTAICSYAFSYMGGINSVVLPDSVTTIEAAAFLNCNGLEEITIGVGLKSVGESAFDGCGALERVHIANTHMWCGVKFANLEANPLYYAHELCLDEVAIDEFVVPADVNKINPYAFAGFSANIEWEEGADAEEICARAFDSFDGARICLPSSIDVIGEYAFDNCDAEIVWEDEMKITEIRANAFSGYEGTSLTIPDSVKKIYSNAFDDCAALEYDGYFIYAGDWVVGVNWDLFSLVESGEHIDMRCRAGTAGIADTEPTSASLELFTWILNGRNTLSLVLPGTLCYLGDYAVGIMPLLYSDCIYEGTIEQWESLTKGKWNYVPSEILSFVSYKDFTVHCTNGQVTEEYVAE